MTTRKGGQCYKAPLIYGDVVKEIAGKVPTRMIDEYVIRERLTKSLKQPTEFGQTYYDTTAGHVRRIVETAEDLSSQLTDEWNGDRDEENQERFLNNQILAQLSLRELRTTMTALADLVQCMQQKYYLGKRTKVRGAKPSITIKAPSTPLQPNPPPEVKIECQDDDADYGIKKEIKEEEVPIEEPIADIFLPLFANNSGAKVPKLEEPEEYCSASTSSNVFAHQELSNRKRKADLMSNSILPFLCHFCKSYNPAAKYSPTPDKPDERRQFLINLSCETQWERNEREVLLISTKHVHFCGKHIPERGATKLLTSNMVNEAPARKRGQRTSPRNVNQPIPNSTPSPKFRFLIVKPPDEI